MNLEQIKKQRNKLLSYKNITPLIESINRLNSIDKQELICNITLNDFVEINLPNINKESLKLIEDVALSLKPWRKGPFKINDIEINSEWDSSIKYNLISKHINAENKIIGDIGCNNGYYMFKMLEKNPKQIIGLDPMPLCKMQFDFIKFFIHESKVKFELLGIEDLEFMDIRFDVLLCLGVLYHRKSPLDSIKTIYNSLKVGGEAIFDSIIISGDSEIALCPNGSYAKMPNVYFIPTLKTFQNWLSRCGFSDIEHIATQKTEINEQRKTKWSNDMSLENFLDSTHTKTIEGYEAPQRAYLKARKLK